MHAKPIEEMVLELVPEQTPTEMVAALTTGMALAIATERSRCRAIVRDAQLTVLARALGKKDAPMAELAKPYNELMDQIG